ncbi:MAG: hypothetical protein OXT01_25420 [Rhodospirillaceae bacterium]|nr:hypothetical protein [Rhodospirillaceae bacterium]
MQTFKEAWEIVGRAVEDGSPDAQVVADALRSAAQAYQDSAIHGSDHHVDNTASRLLREEARRCERLAELIEAQMAALIPF